MTGKRVYRSSTTALRFSLDQVTPSAVVTTRPPETKSPKPSIRVPTNTLLMFVIWCCARGL